MLRRVIVFMFLPVAVTVFLVGWVLYWIGEMFGRRSARTFQERSRVSEESESHGYIEVGLVEELMEEFLLSK